MCEGKIDVGLTLPPLNTKRVVVGDSWFTRRLSSIPKGPARPSETHMNLGYFSTLAFKVLPTRLPGRTPKSKFQRAAQVTFVAIEADETSLPYGGDCTTIGEAVIQEIIPMKHRNAKFISTQTAQDGGYGWSTLSRS